MALATARSPSAATKVPLCLFLRRKGTFCIGGRLRTLSRSEMGSASPAAERWGPEAPEARWEQSRRRRGESLRRYIKSFQFHLGLKGFFIADGLELGQSPMFDHQFSEGERYNEQLLKWPLR